MATVFRQLVIAAGAFASASAAVCGSWDSFTFQRLSAKSALESSDGESTAVQSTNKRDIVHQPECSFNGKISTKSAYKQAIKASSRAITQAMMTYGVPGATVVVSVDGDIVWKAGFGFSDVENLVPCRPDSVMRIASISKPLTAVAVAKLWEEGKIDLDAPVQKYVSNFPEKRFKGEHVTVTSRQLLSNLGCIRHYSTDKANKQPDAEQAEFYIRDHYKTTKDALHLFMDDGLVCKPGSEFHYTTFGWTLLSAVVEGASDMAFLDYMQEKVFAPLGLRTVQPEYHESLAPNRSKPYKRDSEHRLRNTPYVDNSCKWAGGGFIGSAPDLVRFGNALLLAYQGDSKGILQPGTVREMWHPVVDVGKHGKGTGYGWGWFVNPGKTEVHVAGGGTDVPLIVMHTGGAVGASSILHIQPTCCRGNHDGTAGKKPQGVVVAILLNLQCVNAVELTKEIASNFTESRK